MKFELKTTDPNSRARTALISTDHGEIPTPICMPVGTAGSMKAVHQRELKNDIDAKIILGNTYHLYLRPGLDVLENAGGLHKFNTWDRICEARPHFREHQDRASGINGRYYPE